jgi:hypothetical protein
MDTAGSCHICGSRPVAFETGHFEDSRDTLEPRVPQKRSKFRRSDQPFTHIGMPVAVATPRSLRVVEMDAHEAVEADCGGDVAHDGVGLREASVGGTCSKKVLGIEAGADPLVGSGSVENRRQLAEVAPARATGAGRVLHQDPARRRSEHLLHVIKGAQQL